MIPYGTICFGIVSGGTLLAACKRAVEAGPAPVVRVVGAEDGSARRAAPWRLRALDRRREAVPAQLAERREEGRAVARRERGEDVGVHALDDLLGLADLLGARGCD